MPPPLPMPGAFGGAPPIPGVSDTAPPPMDRMTQMAKLMGDVQGSDQASASEDFSQGLSMMESAARKDPRLLPLFQKVMGVLSDTMAGPQGPPGGGLMGAQSPGAGMPLPPGLMG